MKWDWVPWHCPVCAVPVRFLGQSPALEQKANPEEELGKTVLRGCTHTTQPSASPLSRVSPVYYLAVIGRGRTHCCWSQGLAVDELLAFGPQELQESCFSSWLGGLAPPALQRLAPLAATRTKSQTSAVPLLPSPRLAKNTTGMGLLTCTVQNLWSHLLEST